MKILPCLLWLGGMLALQAAVARAADSQAAEVALATELKVSGPAVFVRGPLGLRYRPGCSFPIEVRVHNGGPEFRAELTVGEGGGDSAARCGIFEAVSFPPQASRVFSFPVLAPAVSANLTLQIREIDSSGGTGALRFQASLARVLKPLAPETPLILNVSAGRGGAYAALPDAIQIKAQDLPDQFWQYENIDVVMLSDASLKEAAPDAKEALRLWLVGGGRLFVASSEALAPVVSAGLMPVDEAAAAGLIGADVQWWEKHAGLKRENILKERGNRPVYAFLKLGFGTVVFVFPGTSPEDAIRDGAEVVNHPVLQSQREKFPDLRVQPDRYGAFAAGALSSSQREQTQMWLGLGAVVFCIGLALGFSSRLRLLAAGWPLTVAVLLAVMLAKWFPTRELSASRIEWRRESLDGRAAVRNEWALLEAANNPVAVTISSPVNGTLIPLYAYPDEIGQSQYNYSESGSRLMMQDAVVLPQQSVLITASEVRELKAGRAARRLRAADGAMTIEAGGGRAFGGAAVLARSNGSLWVLSALDSEKGFAIRKFEDWTSLLRGAQNDADDRTVKAQARALAWATRDALRSKRDTLIFWNRGRAEAGADLIGLDNPSVAGGERFAIESVGVSVSE